MSPRNPKDIAASKRVRLDLIPGPAMVPVALALQNGIDKGYGAYNWRNTPIEAMNYIGAALRHIKAWQDGEEYAADSQVHHLGHAAASLMIARQQALQRHSWHKRRRANDTDPAGHCWHHVPLGSGSPCANG